MPAHLDLHGGIASRAGGGGWEITGWEAAEELVVVQKGPGALDIDIPKGKVSKHHPTKLYLLIHGKFDTSATLEDFFDLSVTGNLNALDAKAACTSKTVSETYLSKFAGSLDPPHLACGAPSQIKHGDRITWDIKVQNLGNAPESDIEIVDTLPPSLDWDRVEIQWALWNGKDIEVMVENDTANRILKWRLNNDAEPLLPGHYAQIQFITYVDLDYPCPDLPSGQTSPCQDRDWAGRPIVHRVWTKFHGEQVPGALNEIRHPLQNQETTVLCREACAPNVRPVNSEPGPSYITFWTIGGIIAALAAGLLIWRFYRIRGSR